LQLKPQAAGLPLASQLSPNSLWFVHIAGVMSYLVVVVHVAGLDGSVHVVLVAFP
jgi:hypothetical protein